MVKQCKPLRSSQEKYVFFRFSTVSSGDHPLAKWPEDSYLRHVDLQRDQHIFHGDVEKKIGRLLLRHDSR